MNTEENTTATPPVTEAPPPSEAERFAALCVKYKWPWLYAVASAPRDPSSRALVLSAIHHYPSPDFTPEQLEAAIKAAPPGLVAASGSAWRTPVVPTSVRRAVRTTSVTGGQVPVRVTQDSNYTQWTTDNQRSDLNIDADELEDLIRQALEEDEDFEDALLDKLKEFAKEVDSDGGLNWETTNTDYGDTDNYEYENFDVETRSTFSAWAEARLAEYRQDHPAPDADEEYDADDE